MTISDITVLGPQSTTQRLQTISFTSSRLSSSEIVKHLHKHKIACRNGHNYAHRLVTALGIDINDGVVRLSAVHYNTMDEIEKCIQVLDTILSHSGNDTETKASG
jgi:selenocysteine lyase/cysteine desulfurase